MDNLENAGKQYTFNPLTHLLLPEFALVVLMAVKAPCLTKFAGSIVLLGGILYIMKTVTMGDSVNDYVLGSAVLGDLFFTVTTYIWLSNPLKDFRYLRDPDPSPLESRSFLSRLYNSWSIVRNPRLIGWNVQSPLIPQAFKSTRSQFLWYRLKQTLASIAVADLAYTFLLYNKDLYFANTPGGIGLPPGLKGYVIHGLCAIVWALCSYGVLSTYHNIASLVAVGSGISRPEEWPELFGRLKDLYTVRRLWSRGWHQILGRICVTWGRAVPRSLSLPKGHWASGLVFLHVAFATSGALHALGDFTNPRAHSGFSFVFFYSQAWAITFETLVIALGRRLGIKGPTAATKALGFAWTLLWFSWSVPQYVDWVYTTGASGTDVLPWSPTQRLVIPFIQRCTIFQ